MRVELHHPGWSRHQLDGYTICVRGRAFAESRLLSGPELAHYVAAATTKEELAELAAAVDGFFAVVIETDSNAWAAVDRTRSIPLFMVAEGDAHCLTDRPREVLGEIDPRTFDRSAVDEFLIVSYVTGTKTLHPAVSQVQAAEVVEIAGTNVGRVRYDLLGRGVSLRPSVDKEELLDDHRALIESAVERLIRVANARPIVLPLSAGRDSRLLAMQLVRAGYPDIRAFSYGRRGNAEAHVSERVAAALGIRWAFVPYTEGDWQRWFASSDRVEFFDMADGLTSVPHLMDWPAIQDLRRRGFIPPDSVIVPGHSLDLPAGSRSLYLPDLYAGDESDDETLVRSVLNYHYCLFDWDDREDELLPQFRERILTICGDAPTRSLAFERWDWQERQAKLIVNSVRAYEHAGLDWWMPWWDVRLVRFWASVPTRFKREKVLYDGYVDRLGHDFGFAAPNNRITVGAALRSRARRAVRRRPQTFSAARTIVRALRRLDWRRLYEGHPMAWYGLVPPDTFRENFTGRESILAFLALERVGRVSLG